MRAMRPYPPRWPRQSQRSSNEKGSVVMGSVKYTQSGILTRPIALAAGAAAIIAMSVLTAGCSAKEAPKAPATSSSSSAPVSPTEKATNMTPAVPNNQSCGPGYSKVNGTCVK